MRDIFVSYSHKDAEWVKGVLVPKLENRGFSVLIDYRDFETGKFGVEEMQRGVEDTRHTILVLTPDYVVSEWTKFENVMGQSLDPGAAKRKLIPILRKDCKLPLRLQIIHFRDLRTDDPEQWELLIRDLIG